MRISLKRIYMIWSAVETWLPGGVKKANILKITGIQDTKKRI